MGGGQSAQSSVSFLQKLRTAAGRRVRSWGSKGTGPGQFQIPTASLTDGKTLYVADRTTPAFSTSTWAVSYIGEWNHPAGLLRSRSRAACCGSQSCHSKPEAGQVMRASPWFLKVDPGSAKLWARSRRPVPTRSMSPPPGNYSPAVVVVVRIPAASSGFAAAANRARIARKEEKHGVTFLRDSFRALGRLSSASRRTSRAGPKRAR